MSPSDAKMNSQLAHSNKSWLFLSFTAVFYEKCHKPSQDVIIERIWLCTMLLQVMDQNLQVVFSNNMFEARSILFWNVSFSFFFPMKNQDFPTKQPRSETIQLSWLRLTPSLRLIFLNEGSWIEKHFQFQVRLGFSVRRALPHFLLWANCQLFFYFLFIFFEVDPRLLFLALNTFSTLH